MAYINDHKILSGEEMMIGYVAAQVGLSAGFPGVPDQRSSGAAAHRDTADRHIGNMRATDDLEAELRFDIFNELNASHWLRKVSDRT